MYYLTTTSYKLSPDDKAAAINLAFLLDLSGFDSYIIKLISYSFTEEEKTAVYNFWKNLTPLTAKAWLCMAEFEGKI